MNSFQVEHEEKQRNYSILYHDIIDYEFPTGHCKFVYTALIRFADNKSGEAYPSVQRLANICQCTDRTVQKSLKQLEESGFIRRQMRKTTTLYTLLKRDWTSSPEKFTGENNSEHKDKSPEKFTGEKFTGENNSPKPRKILHDAPKNFPSSSEEFSGKQYHLTLTNNNNSEHKQLGEEEAAAAAPADPFFDALQKLGNGRANYPLMYEQISSWQEEGFEDASISLALEKAMQGAKDFYYAVGIINQWRKKNLFTYEQCSNEKKQQQAKPLQKAAGGETFQHEGRPLEAWELHAIKDARAGMPIHESLDYLRKFI